MNLYIFGTRGIELSLKKKRGTVIKKNSKLKNSAQCRGDSKDYRKKIK